jgi:hypothetical protein
MLLASAASHIIRNTRIRNGIQVEDDLTIGSPPVTMCARPFVARLSARRRPANPE